MNISAEDVTIESVIIIRFAICTQECFVISSVLNWNVYYLFVVFESETNS